mmetsp:Transcript_56612/g.165551  ORF Transcript_56612/g.165551 Transcript_56612/m.165551 type:complete len:235 (-) Transcript_56612:449-1153(-)
MTCFSSARASWYFTEILTPSIEPRLPPADHTARPAGVSLFGGTEPSLVAMATRPSSPMRFSERFSSSSAQEPSASASAMAPLGPMSLLARSSERSVVLAPKPRAMPPVPSGPSAVPMRFSLASTALPLSRPSREPAFCRAKRLRILPGRAERSRYVTERFARSASRRAAAPAWPMLLAAKSICASVLCSGSTRAMASAPPSPSELHARSRPVKRSLRAKASTIPFAHSGPTPES